MAKKSLEILTETMFYVLMAFQKQEMCGADIVSFIERRTKSRLHIGPGTLYTILAKFEEENLIEETAVEGRKRTYRITPQGKERYEEEIRRLRICLADAEAEAYRDPQRGSVPYEA